MFRQVFNDIRSFEEPIEVDWRVVGIVAIFAAVFIVYGWIVFNHGHVFSIGSEAVPFSSGHASNGDASIFGVDNFHFRNE